MQEPAPHGVRQRSAVSSISESWFLSKNNVLRVVRALIYRAPCSVRLFRAAINRRAPPRAGHALARLTWRRQTLRVRSILKNGTQNVRPPTPNWKSSILRVGHAFAQQRAVARSEIRILFPLSLPSSPFEFFSKILYPV